MLHIFCVLPELSLCRLGVWHILDAVPRRMWKSHFIMTSCLHEKCTKQQMVQNVAMILMGFKLIVCDMTCLKHHSQLCSSGADQLLQARSIFAEHGLPCLPVALVLASGYEVGHRLLHQCMVGFWRRTVRPRGARLYSIATAHPQVQLHLRRQSLDEACFGSVGQWRGIV